MALPTPENPAEYPRTVDAAVDLLLSKMTDESKAWLAQVEGGEFEFRRSLAPRFGAGMSVRAILGLWGSNAELLAQVPPNDRHPDDASSYFLWECARRLRSSAYPADEAEPGGS